MNYFILFLLVFTVKQLINRNRCFKKKGGISDFVSKRKKVFYILWSFTDTGLCLGNNSKKSKRKKKLKYAHITKFWRKKNYIMVESRRDCKKEKKKTIFKKTPTKKGWKLWRAMMITMSWRDMTQKKKTDKSSKLMFLDSVHPYSVATLKKKSNFLIIHKTSRFVFPPFPPPCRDSWKTVNNSDDVWEQIKRKPNNKPRQLPVIIGQVYKKQK